MKRLIGLALGLFFLGGLLLPFPMAAQQEFQESRDVRATVEKIIHDDVTDGVRAMIFDARDKEGNVYRVNTAESYLEGLRYDLREQDTVILQLIPNGDGTETAFLSDVYRVNWIALVAIVFALITVAVGLWRGFFAIVGVLVTVGVLFLYIFPQILAGADPVFTTFIGSVIILGINMHLSHGFSKGVFAAFGSSVLGLLLAVVFANLFVYLAKLSGLGSEEATFLFWQGGGIDPHGLLLAGILLGAVGVLDDISVAQTELVAELRQADPKISKKDLFAAAMRVGRHHIASTVNTLVLAYVGVGMPLFLLFMSSSVSMPAFLNTELVAEEIIRTLAGTTALVLTVPIATYFATHIKPETHS